MKLPSPRIILAVVLSGLAVGVLVWMLRPQPTPVEIVRVTRGPLSTWVAEQGRTRVREVYVVSAPLTGKTVRVTLHAGDRVKAGDTVALIRPADPPLIDARSEREVRASVDAAEAAVQLAQAELRRAEAQATYAEAELRRGQTLNAQGVIAAQALDQRRLAHETARAAVAEARAAVAVRQRERDSLRSRLARPADSDQGTIAVRAPVGGRVLRVDRESEQVVQAGQPILQIGDPADIDVIVELLSTDAVEVKPGAAAAIEGWGGQPLQARVRRVEPAGFTKVSALGVEEQRVLTYLDFATPAQAAALGHDYRVTARIVTWSAPSVVRVPASALFRQGEDWAVYRVARGRAELVRVKVGRRNEDFAEVQEGLGEGDSVVAYPGDRLKDGVSVRATPR